MSLVSLRSIVLESEDERLGEQDKEGTNNGNKEEVHLKVGLEFTFEITVKRSTHSGVPSAGLQSHLDKDVDDAGGFTDIMVRCFIKVPWNAPLQNNQECHITESESHEEKHGDEFKDEINDFSVEDAVKTSKEDTKEHVSDTQDDSELHLEGVEEGKLVGGTEPAGIHADGIVAL